MRRIAWRKVLPIVQFVAYILLIWYGCWYRPTWEHWFRNWISPLPASIGWYPVWIDGIESFPEQFAAGLNFPAAVISALVLIPFESQLRTGASRELVWHIVTVICIPLLWFMVGKGLDAPETMKAVRLSKTAKSLTVAGLAALVLIALLMVADLVVGERYTRVGLSFAWIGCGILAVWSRLRHPRRDMPERRS